MAVYFIAEEGTERVKIGYAWHPWSRLTTLQKRHPRKITLMRIVHGDRADERAAHKKFVHLHLEGEWFTYSDEMWDFERSIDIGPRYSKYSPIQYGRPAQEKSNALEAL